jgi:hypothetical protein
MAMEELGGWAAKALPLLFQAVLLAARWAGGRRRRGIEELARMEGCEKEREILLLRDKVSRLEALVGLLQRQLAKGPHRTRYTLEERLCILWHLEAFQIPRRRVREYFGVARSTIYRWFHEGDDPPNPARRAASKKPASPPLPSKIRLEERWIAPFAGQDRRDWRAGEAVRFDSMIG